MKPPKKIMTDLDYVEFYAQKLREDNRYFKQHKKFIEAQFTASSSLFRNMFKGKDFKTEARKYLKGRGLI